MVVAILTKMILTYLCFLQLHHSVFYPSWAYQRYLPDYCNRQPFPLFSPHFLLSLLVASQFLLSYTSPYTAILDLGYLFLVSCAQRSPLHSASYDSPLHAVVLASFSLSTATSPSSTQPVAICSALVCMSCLMSLSIILQQGTSLHRYSLLSLWHLYLCFVMIN